MDDWSKVPSRQAVSEPAPNHQSPLSRPASTTARLSPPPQAPTHGADHARPQHRALDPSGLTRQHGNQAGAEPRNPFYHRPIPLITPAPTQPNIKNSQTRLDIHRPFMDDDRLSISGSAPVRRGSREPCFRATRATRTNPSTEVRLASLEPVQMRCHETGVPTAHFPDARGAFRIAGQGSVQPRLA